MRVIGHTVLCMAPAISEPEGPRCWKHRLASISGSHCALWRDDWMDEAGDSMNNELTGRASIILAFGMVGQSCGQCRGSRMTRWDSPVCTTSFPSLARTRLLRWLADMSLHRDGERDRSADSADARMELVGGAEIMERATKQWEAMVRGARPSCRRHPGRDHAQLVHARAVAGVTPHAFRCGARCTAACRSETRRLGANDEPLSTMPRPSPSSVK